MDSVARILLADDHPLVVRALTSLLGREPDLEIVGDVGSFDELADALDASSPDVLVFDVGMPGGDAVEVLRRVNRSHPDVRVLVLSGYPEEEFVVRMINAGAVGFVQKESEPSALVDAIRQVANGGMYVSARGAQALAQAAAGRGSDHERLSDRELQVLRMLGLGQSVSDIAQALHLSPKTVSTYRTRLMEKMGFATTAEIIHYAVRRGLV